MGARISVRMVERIRGRGLLTRARLIVVVSLALGYVVLGYTVAPSFLIPAGCDGGLGDPAVTYVPVTAFQISYESDANAVTVRHSGGDTLPAARTDALEIRIRSSDAQTGYSWTSEGGSYPIRDGDSLTIADVTINGRHPTAGDVISVHWTGTWPDPQPNYCPNDHPTYASRTLNSTEL